MTEKVWLIRTPGTIGIFTELGIDVEGLTELEAMKEAQRAISREIRRRDDIPKGNL